MSNWTKQEIREEQQANYFAMCLLMPEEIFIDEWKKLIAQKISEDNQVIQLAKIFQVPLFAVPIRMQMIHFLETQTENR